MEKVSHTGKSSKININRSSGAFGTFPLGKEYDFWVIDTASELKNLIFEKNKMNNKSRLLARYCRNWISDAKDDTDVHDFVIDDFSMSWNLRNSKTWAIDEDSINEISCTHTSQGLEFDYVGVIIGEELQFDGGGAHCN